MNNNSDRAFDWQKLGQQIQEYIRVSSQDMWKLGLLFPRTQKEMLQNGLKIFEDQIKTVQDLEIGTSGPGVGLLESARNVQLFSMKTQAEMLKGYLALVEGTLNVLEDIEPFDIASSTKDTEGKDSQSP